VDEESGEVIKQSQTLHSGHHLKLKEEQRRIARCRSALERCFVGAASNTDRGGAAATPGAAVSAEAFAIDMCIELEGSGGASGAAGRIAARGTALGEWGGFLVWLVLIGATAALAAWAVSAQDAALHLQPYVGHLQRGFKAVRGAVPWTHRQKSKVDPPSTPLSDNKQDALENRRRRSRDSQGESRRQQAVGLSTKHLAALEGYEGGVAQRAERLLKRRQGAGGRLRGHDTDTAPEDDDLPRLLHSTEFRAHSAAESTTACAGDDPGNSAQPSPPAGNPPFLDESVRSKQYGPKDDSADDSDGFVVPSSYARTIAPGMRPLTAVNSVPRG